MSLADASQPDEDDKTTQRCLKIIRQSGMGLIQSKREIIMAGKLDFCSEEKDILSLLSAICLLTCEDILIFL